MMHRAIIPPYAQVLGSFRPLTNLYDDGGAAEAFDQKDRAEVHRERQQVSGLTTEERLHWR